MLSFLFFLRYTIIKEGAKRYDRYRKTHKIKELRNERDLTIEMVVADMNRKFNFDPPYHKSMISRWENQKSEPTLENAKYLSLIITIAELCGFLICLLYNP